MGTIESPLPLKKSTPPSHPLTKWQQQQQNSSSNRANSFGERESLHKSIQLLESRELELDPVGYAALIRRCGAANAISAARRLHSHILSLPHSNSQPPFLANLLIEMYGKCGRLPYARELFESMPSRNVHTWTVAMAAFSHNGCHSEALVFFRRMYQSGERPDRVTFSVILAAIAQMGAAAIDQGREIHRYARISGLLPNVVVGTAVISMYGKCGRLDDARAAFEELQWKNSVTWNAMMTNYKLDGRDREALELFREMCERSRSARPDKFSFSIAIEACSNLEDLEQGREIHEMLRREGKELHKDVVVGTALLNMYSKCGDLEEARKVFDSIRHDADSVCWNAMIAAYAQHGRGKQALDLYRSMHDTTDLAPKQGTFVTVIDVCAELSALKQGRAIHARVRATNFDANLLVSNALVHMYGKCGCLDEALDVFHSMKLKDEISWNTIISSYAYHGHSDQALLLYQEMDLQGVKPTEVTFVGLLSACSHGGLVADGLDYFYRMQDDHRIKPSVPHFGCIIDLLGRGGRLAEAELVLKSMPIQANAVQWMSLLGACKTHGDLKRGVRAADQVVDRVPWTSGGYVLLSNIYAAAGRWKDVEKIRKIMAARGVKKSPGKSWIEIGDVVHEFVSGDSSHPQGEEIYVELGKMVEEMKGLGYVPDTSSVFHDLEEEEKEDLLVCHSEKLAIVYGNMVVPGKSMLRIVKNLRVCLDCHTATKFMSRITGRKIVVRDAARFHLFENGSCSCRDYW
ncbi:pentatricopeptide repeat-containing protein At4g21065 [Selaginella moellendorffii]|uniref:pentatricopeptide repeat-containing protein At4g21065 n=1 Tax=Selaginella moellendorffii TaxID=88036 RepID=UPI000D1C8ECE|nr:pentatricopeptide repeat-containing protein At4g21065 [Selaginella moellendorffii]|eukprot:XP_024528371.1 pentatricopeptide repeat-containing protein At4g21065 [Selaginella moellendorffii]